MFTGIIEAFGTIKAIVHDQSNLHITVESPFTKELKVDQSVAHNGICLTVVNISGESYTVTAIQETIDKTAISDWKVGDKVNLERAMIMGTRLDGHIVQGHVDSKAICIGITPQNGSTLFTFEYPEQFKGLVIEKGSICINGISLTAFNCINNKVSVAIIPYTMQHTMLQFLKEGDAVNVEYDIIGKYILRQNHI